jgi:hypothetical protein
MESEPTLKLIHFDIPTCISCNHVLQKNKILGGICLKCFNSRIVVPKT